MSLKNCSIVFDNRPNGLFYSGETVSGLVNLLMEKNKICQALMLEITGCGECNWSETTGNGKHKKIEYFRGNETYFETSFNLLPQQFTDVSELVTGQYSFRFCFVLPSNLPSSIEGSCGFIRYDIKVSLQRPDKINLIHKMTFSVITHVNLNLIPNIQLPIVDERNKNLYFLFSKKGSLYLTIKIPRSGYISGECILINCVIKNESNIKLDLIKIRLVKIITFTAALPYTKTKVETSKICRGHITGINFGEEKLVEVPLNVPASPPTSFTSSSIIDIKYELQACAVISGIRSNLTSITPIIIGTIPLNTSSNTIVQPFNSSSMPSAPPMEYVNTALPPYEDMDFRRMEEVEKNNINNNSENIDFSYEISDDNFDTKA